MIFDKYRWVTVTTVLSNVVIGYEAASVSRIVALIGVIILTVMMLYDLWWRK